MGIRKTIAGWFIRTGQRIYRPTIADLTAEFNELLLVKPGSGEAITVPLRRSLDQAAIDRIVRDWRKSIDAFQSRMQRRESRGWN